MAGRKKVITPQATEAICAALRLGATLGVAARCAGVGLRTVQTWLARGKSPEATKEEKTFSKAVEAARCLAEVRLLEVIDNEAKKGNWRAAAWKLERIWPERYAKVERAKAAEPETPAPEPDAVDAMSPVELEAVLGDAYGWGH